MYVDLCQKRHNEAVEHQAVCSTFLFFVKRLRLPRPHAMACFTMFSKQPGIVHNDPWQQTCGKSISIRMWSCPCSNSSVARSSFRSCPAAGHGTQRLPLRQHPNRPLRQWKCLPLCARTLWHIASRPPHKSLTSSGQNRCVSHMPLSMLDASDTDHQHCDLAINQRAATSQAS